jgi:hypothetical protein
MLAEILKTNFCGRWHWCLFTLMDSWDIYNQLCGTRSIYGKRTFLSPSLSGKRTYTGSNLNVKICLRAFADSLRHLIFLYVLFVGNLISSDQIKKFQNWECVKSTPGGRFWRACIPCRRRRTGRRSRRRRQVPAAHVDVGERLGVAGHGGDGELVGGNLWQRPAERGRPRGGYVDGGRLLRPERRGCLVVRPEKRDIF